MSKAQSKKLAFRKKEEARLDRALRPGHGNPHWGRAHVTISRQQNWKPEWIDKKDGRRAAPITLSASPGADRKRVGVSLGESYLTEQAHNNDPTAAKRQMLELRIKTWAQQQGFSELVTIAQALSFEEAVRAVFRAAREEGILPAVHHDEI